MQAWRTKSGALAILLWTMILLSGAFGCGNDGSDSVSLPNGYTLSSWSWGETWIDDQDGDRVGDRHFSIARCQVEGNLFFGAYHDVHRNDQRTRAYFIVDTARDKYQPFMDKDKWEEVLQDLGGVEHPQLLSVSAFAEQKAAAGARLIVLVIGSFVLGTLILIALVVWGFERAHRRADQDRL